MAPFQNRCQKQRGTASITNIIVRLIKKHIMLIQTDKDYLDANATCYSYYN